MTSSLPVRPSLDQLRHQAKDLLRSHRTGDAGSCEVLRAHHRFRGASDERILSAKVGLQDVQHAVALRYGFKSWNDMKRAVLARDSRRFMHVFCLEGPAQAHRAAAVPGEVVAWIEPLFEGPAPDGLSDEEFALVRAEYHVASGNSKTVGDNLHWQKQMNDALNRWREYEEVVLWFDQCLFDHVILIRHLDWFSRRDMGRTKLSLVYSRQDIGNSAKIAPLLESRREVTAEQLALGTNAWKAYRSADPHAIEELISEDTSALPRLAGAMADHMRRFPSVKNGLDAVENAILRAVADREGMPAVNLIGGILAAGMGEYPYMGDGSVARLIKGLCSAPMPLLRVSDPGDLEPPYGKGEVGTTSAGREALAGKLDWVQVHGIDRWLGGVHLEGREVPWRWYEETGGSAMIVRFGGDSRRH